MRSWIFRLFISAFEAMLILLYFMIGRYGAGDEAAYENEIQDSLCA